MSDSSKYLLLAEDDKVVAELIQHALVEHDPTLRIVHVRDGVEALDFLYARERYDHRDPAPPSVVLLDVKMPRLDGLEVLRQVKSDERLKTTPIVMLTSSQDERDIRESYALGANAYVVKPVEFRRFAAILRHLEVFWMKINQPPQLDLAVGETPDRATSPTL
jgi:two-component system response regulator